MSDPGFSSAGTSLVDRAVLETKIRELEAAIGRLTHALGSAADGAIAGLVDERREMRLELQKLRDEAGPSNVVRLPGRGGARS